MISAILLAAGRSQRMGQPKMLMPWGNSTVLQTVIETFRSAELEDILVVTGAGREQIEALIGSRARTIYNPEFETGEMLGSIQAGLGAQTVDTEAALIGLGDQPQAEREILLRILQAHEESHASLIVPSYQNRRGHPWLVGREHWEEIALLRSPASMRDFFRAHSSAIHYVEADNASILADLDTPEDYARYRPG